MTDQQEYIARIAAIADVVAAEAEQAEIDRRLGDKTVDALRETGLLRMLLPAHYGGGGLHIGDTFPIVEAMSRVNGSAGWNLQIGATTAALANDLADDGARDEVLGNERAIVAGTINFMNIKARRADGGYVFDGDATFLSGSSHADWLVIGGWLHDDDGKPQFPKAHAAHRPRRDPDRRDRGPRHLAGQRHRARPRATTRRSTRCSCPTASCARPTRTGLARRRPGRVAPAVQPLRRRACRGSASASPAARSTR